MGHWTLGLWDGSQVNSVLTLKTHNIPEKLLRVDTSTTGGKLWKERSNFPATAWPNRKRQFEVFGQSVQPCDGQLSRAARSFTSREGWVNRLVAGCRFGPLMVSLLPYAESVVWGSQGGQNENRRLVGS